MTGKIQLFKQFNEKYSNLLDNLCSFFGADDETLSTERKWVLAQVAADPNTKNIHSMMKDIPEEAVSLLQAADSAVFEKYPSLPLTNRIGLQKLIQRCYDDSEKQKVWAMLKPTIGVLCTVDVLGSDSTTHCLSGVAQKLQESNIMSDIQGRPPQEAMQMLLPKLMSQDGLLTAVSDSIFQGGENSVFRSIMQNSSKLLKGMNLDIPLDLPDEVGDGVEPQQNTSSEEKEHASNDNATNTNGAECPKSLKLAALEEPPAPSAIFRGKKKNRKKGKGKRKQKNQQTQGQAAPKSLVSLLEDLKGEEENMDEVQSAIQGMLKTGQCASELQSVMNMALQGKDSMAQLMKQMQAST